MRIIIEKKRKKIRIRINFYILTGWKSSKVRFEFSPSQIFTI